MSTACSWISCPQWRTRSSSVLGNWSGYYTNMMMAGYASQILTWPYPQLLTSCRHFAYALTALSKALLPVRVFQPVPSSLALPVMDVDLYRVAQPHWLYMVHHNNDLPRPLTVVARHLLMTELPERCHRHHSAVSAPCPLVHTAAVLSSAPTLLYRPPEGGATLWLNFASGETVHQAQAP